MGRKRRSLLKAIGASTTLGAAMSTAAAKNEDEAYETPQSVISAIENYGGELLQQLEDRGVIPNSSPSSLGIGQLVSRKDYIDSDEAVRSNAVVEDGTATHQILVKRRFKGRKVLIKVLPDIDKAYAFEYEKAGRNVDVSAIAVHTENGSKIPIEPRSVATDGGTAAGDLTAEPTVTCSKGEVGRITPGGPSCPKYEVYCCFNEGTCYWGDSVCCNTSGTCYSDCYSACGIA